MSEGMVQRQGSQYLGTMQSQLAVEHESIRNSFLHTQYGSEELVSVSGCYTSTSSNTDRPEGPECGSKSETDQGYVAEA